MERYIFELRLRRIEAEIKQDMGWMMRAKIRTSNAFLKNQHLGLTKIFANSYKIDRSKLTDEDYNSTVQCIQVYGTKDFCENERQILEGLDEEQVKAILPSQEAQGIISRAGKSISRGSEILKGKGWTSFVTAMATMGILITLDVFPEVK